MISKLSLNKETIETLDAQEMNAANGGFTYSLSLGTVCKQSKYLGAENAYECGKLTPSVEEEVEEDNN